MKKFLKSKIGKCFLYTLLCICVFGGIWLLLGWLLYDFNYLENIPSRMGYLMQFVFSGIVSYVIIIKIDFEINYW